MPAPTTSLLVTTYNWPHALALVLESVLRNRVLPDEVVVADDGSGPETASVVREAAPRLQARGVALVHAWHPDEGQRTAEVRNLGLSRARGDYVLQVDGDCVLAPDFVAAHRRAARPGRFVQGSRVMVDPGRTARALADRDPCFGVSQRGLRSRHNGLAIRPLCALVSGPQNGWRHARGCNMGYWRADAFRVNGYDTRMVGWGGEDVDFTARLLAAGLVRWRLKFGGSVYHLHHPPRSRDRSAYNHALHDESVRRGGGWTRHGITPGDPPAEAAAEASSPAGDSTGAALVR